VLTSDGSALANPSTLTRLDFAYQGWRYENETALTIGSGADTQYETGLFHTPTRDDDPATDRALQPDPAGQGTNWSIMLGNNPIDNVDPSGLSFFSGSGGVATQDLLSSWALSGEPSLASTSLSIFGNGGGSSNVLSVSGPTMSNPLALAAEAANET